MTNSKHSMIPPYALFFVLFVSRLVVTLTYVQSVSVGEFSSDLLISIALSLILIMLLSLPVYFVCSKGKNPLNNKWISMLYSIYFVYLVSVNISRFSYFASSRMNTKITMSFMIAIIVLATCYGAYLGLESISRFGFLCGIFLIITLFAVLGLNIPLLSQTNFYPIVTNERIDIYKNAILFTANSVEPALLLCLYPRVNGNGAKPYFLAMLVSYFSIFVMVVFCVGVMGSGADYQSYPIFTLFQLASLGGFSRLDMLHTAFWILAMLMKCSLLAYCSSVCIKLQNHSAKTVAVSIVAGAGALLINGVIGTKMLDISKVISLVCFGFLVVIIPLAFSLRGKKYEKN